MDTPLYDLLRRELGEPVMDGAEGPDQADEEEPAGRADRTGRDEA